MTANIEVLLPGGVVPKRFRGIAPRVDTLAGKTIALLDNQFNSTAAIYREFQTLLEKSEVKEVIYKRKLLSKPLPQEDWDDVAKRADVVVAALGG